MDYFSNSKFYILSERTCAKEGEGGAEPLLRPTIIIITIYYLRYDVDTFA